MSDLAQDLIAAAEEAAAFMRGEETGAVVHQVPSPKEVRQKAAFTQQEMAPLLGMSLSGYRKIERGERSISGAAAILLKVLDKEPDAVKRALAD